MRQPEIGRVGRLLLAVLLALPVLGGAERVAVSAAFLLQFTHEGWPVLTALTRTPVESTRRSGAAAFTPRTVRPPTPLVLVHGVTPEGNGDPRLRRAARLLARAGFSVIVPTLPGLTQARLRPEDAAPVLTALATAPRRAVLVTVSVGCAPALLAATDPLVRGRVALIVTLGGYASAPELIRFYLTGDYRYDGVTGHRALDPRLLQAFVDANRDLMDSATRTLPWGQVDGATADRVLAAAPPRVRGLFEALSPARVVADVPAPLVIIHGRDDPVIPYTESLRLAAAAPRGTRLVVADALGHVGTPGGGAAWVALGRLWGAVYRLVSLA